MSTRPAETPEDILEAADADVRQADDTLSTLEQRVLDGDQDVKPDDIEKARSLRHWAGLMQKRAARRAEELRQQQLAAEREQALTEARQILDAHDDTAVDAALAAAGKAMLKLREAVRARNEARQHALKRLQASPVEQCDPAVGHQRGAPLPTYPVLGHGRAYSSDEILWVDRRAYPHLDENTVMDKARKYPDRLDHEAAEQARKDAAARRLDADMALYREDRAAFDLLPAARRKPAVEALGIDWAHYSAPGLH